MLAVWSIVKGVNCDACTKQMQSIRGCDEPTARPYQIRIGRHIAETDVCPHKYVKECQGVIEAFMFYKKNMLPNPGTWLDQSMLMFQCFDLIEYCVDKLGDKDGR